MFDKIQHPVACVNGFVEACDALGPTPPRKAVAWVPVLTRGADG
jgi:hypothetical protein